MLAPRIAGARVLDGYAGTARSASRRSAAARRTVTFRRAGRRAQALIAANLARCGVADWLCYHPRDCRVAALATLRERPRVRAVRHRPARSAVRRSAADRGRARAAAASVARRQAGRGRARARRQRRRRRPRRRSGVARWRSRYTSSDPGDHADVFDFINLPHVHPSRLSRLLRPADQRPRRHHHARRAAVRPHHRRDPA